MEELLKPWITKHQTPVAVVAVLLGVGVLLFAAGMWLSILAQGPAATDKFAMRFPELVGFILIFNGGYRWRLNRAIKELQRSLRKRMHA